MLLLEEKCGKAILGKEDTTEHRANTCECMVYTRGGELCQTVYVCSILVAWCGMRPDGWGRMMEGSLLLTDNADFVVKAMEIH